MSTHPTILVTAFEPFGGASMNPSLLVAERLTLNDPVCGARVATAVLPVVAATVESVLRDAIDRTRPGAIVSLGECRGSPHVRIERVAVNLLDFAADNSGAACRDAPVVPGGPAAYRATVPDRPMRDAVAARGIPCELSMSAGTYLCNQVMYLSLHYAATSGNGLRAGFIHLPSLPQQRINGHVCCGGMDIERQVEAVRTALEVVAAAAGAAVAREASYG